MDIYPGFLFSKLGKKYMAAIPSYTELETVQVSLECLLILQTSPVIYQT